MSKIFLLILINIIIFSSLGFIIIKNWNSLFEAPQPKIDTVPSSTKKSNQLGELSCTIDRESTNFKITSFNFSERLNETKIYGESNNSTVIINFPGKEKGVFVYDFIQNPLHTPTDPLVMLLLDTENYDSYAGKQAKVVIDSYAVEYLTGSLKATVANRENSESADGKELSYIEVGCNFILNVAPSLTD